MAYGLLLLRGVVGLTMAGHGVQKLFGWFGGPGRRGTADMFGSLGFPAPAALAVLAGLAETGGLLFALGLLTPLAALGIAVVMLNAIGSVHWQKGFWNMAGGYEFPLVMLTAAVAVSATGPGRFSLEQRPLVGRGSPRWRRGGLVAHAGHTSRRQNAPAPSATTATRTPRRVAQSPQPTPEV